MRFLITRLILSVWILVTTLIMTLMGNLLATGAQPPDRSTIYIPVMIKGETQVFPPPPTPSPIPDPPAWLIYLNDQRALASIPPIEDNNSWSNGCWEHARYMVKNDTITHYQDPSNPWYTSDGSQAALASNLLISSALDAPDTYVMQHWLTGPFHGVSLLDPRLRSTGFGIYREDTGNWRMGACFDVLRGRGEVPAGIQYPLTWPANGSSMPYLAYTGGEYPDPLSSCPGYTTPSGPPIYLLLGSGERTPDVTAHSFTRDGMPLEHCVYDETSYTNPKPEAQYLGRSILDGRDAIILIPRQPLEPNTVYTVAITTDGDTQTWTFTTPNVGASHQSLQEIKPEVIIR